ncbi:MAG: 4Fe-4S dicluster domain-containing protein [Candidatus Thorarchaeota archaeon]|jgi:heterodisulfide reductase subunit C
MTSEPHSPNSDFAIELSRQPGGELLSRCIQCGICTATCPVSSASDVYRPRRLIQKILIGKREEVLQSDVPWFCMTCRMCEDRCQEDVSPADIFQAVRHLAVQEGRIPEIFRSTAELVLADGWLLKESYSDFIEDDREDLGLDKDLHWNSDFTKRVKKRYFGGGI